MRDFYLDDEVSHEPPDLVCTASTLGQGASRTIFAQLLTPCRCERCRAKNRLVVDILARSTFIQIPLAK